MRSNRSTSYMEGLMSRLRDAGFVTGRKGPGGGYYLSRPAVRITVAEIFRAFDEPRWREYQRTRNTSLPQSAIDKIQRTDLLCWPCRFPLITEYLPTRLGWR